MEIPLIDSIQMRKYNSGGIYHSIRLKISMEAMKVETLLVDSKNIKIMMRIAMYIILVAAIWTVSTNANAALKISRIRLCREQAWIDS